MSTIHLDTGFNIEVEFRISPFHRRLLAWIIDIALLAAYLYVVDHFMETTINPYRVSDWGWLQVLVLLPFFFYHLFCEIYLNGQSLGKKALKIKVITAEGGAPTTSQYLLRWVFRLIDIGLWGIPALLTVIITPSSQRLGDLVAGTLVIDTKRDLSWQDTVFEVVEEDYQPKYPGVMQLSDKDINTLKSIVQDNRKKNDFRMAASVTERIRQKFGIETKEAPEEFLQTLLKDYNYYTNA